MPRSRRNRLRNRQAPPTRRRKHRGAIRSVGGVYSNDDETGIPFERPAEFAGRRIEDITPAELAEANKRRTEQFNAGVAGTEFAGGLRPPTHLIFDSFDRKNSTPWLVVDPPDGTVPPLTDEARQRAQRPQSGLGRGVSSNINSVGPFNSYEDLGLYDRCVTRGIPSSMMPAGYGSFYEIIQGQESVSLRYEMIHEHRVVPIDRGGRRSPHLSDRIHLDLGDARGWYDGNTLVVETTNFTERSAFRGRERTSQDDRALHARRAERPGVARDVRRSAHVDETVDVRDDPERGDSRRETLRVRLPRR